MKVEFTEVFEQNCQGKFQITREQVRQTVINPDSQQILQLDGLVIGFFIKRITRQSPEFLVLTCARKDGEDWLVDLAFKVLPELVVGLGVIEPLMVLQQLVHRFGLTLKIGHQLNKFIMQEEIPIEEGMKESTQILEVLNPANHTVVQSMFMKIDDHNGNRSIKCAIAYALDTDEYTSWLLGRKADQEVKIDIQPQLRGHATPRDLIVSTGTITFWSNYRELGGEKKGFLFRVISKEYYLEVGFTSTHFYITRNQHRLEMPLEPVYKPTGKVFCVAVWEPTELRLTMLDEAYEESVSGPPEADRVAEVDKRTRLLETPPTLPPNSLLAWARRETIAPTVTYNSPDEFYETVTSLLQSIKDKVSTLGLRNPFWNITYEGPKVISRQPKRETDIHPTIHGLLFDLAIAKHLEIIPEYPIAGGRLDFLFSGVLSTGKVVSVCVEFKHAHSRDDLLHGLLTQLPAYMRAKSCEYGIYCVMFFKGPYFEEPRDYSLLDLGVFLYQEKVAAGLMNVRVLMLDLSYPRPPSKL